MRRTLLLGASLFAISCSSKVEMPAMVGEPPPPLVVSQWVEGEPVHEFETGAVHIICLWTSMCMDRSQLLEDIGALGKQYGGELKLVAVSVMEFCPGKVENAVPKGMGFSAALDSVPSGEAPNLGLTARSWLGVSILAQVPMIGIIDKEGRLAWFGQPPGYREPLQEIISGTWDLDSYADAYESEWRQHESFVFRSCRFFEKTGWSRLGGSPRTCKSSGWTPKRSST